tara:strand:+ start:50 stop:265 length:216 start_codon:yes stop_codon:yes gene_type:complete
VVINYIGGSLDGQKVKPSLVKESLKSNIPIVHFTRYFDDYWMYLSEYYQCEKNNDKVTCKLIKTERGESSG